MEEGTGLSLYKLVGIILFGLFVVMVTTFGTGLQEYPSDLVSCVQSYVLDDSPECGGSGSNGSEGTVNPTDTRVGPSGNEWLNLEQTERNDLFNEFLTKVTNDVEGVEETGWYNRLVTHETSSREYSGAIYGVYNEDGQLVKTYSYGLNSSSNYSSVGFKYIDVNDVRLVPAVVINEGTVNHYNAYSRYMHIDDNGNEVWYRVYSK